MADILSQDEIDALLPDADDDGAPIVITQYDFKHPARVNKHQLRTLENLHDNFARLLSSTFSGAMRAVVDVDTAFVDQTTYAEFILSLSNPSCSYQFTLGPTNGQAIIDISMPGIDGVETLRQLKVIIKNLKGILSSGGLTADFVLDRELDFLILRKPYRLQELIEVVRQAQASTKTT